MQLCASGSPQAALRPRTQHGPDRTPGPHPAEARADTQVGTREAGRRETRPAAGSSQFQPVPTGPSRSQPRPPYTHHLRALRGSFSRLGQVTATRMQHPGLREAGVHQHLGQPRANLRSLPSTRPLIGHCSGLRRCDWTVFRAPDGTMLRRQAPDWTALRTARTVLIVSPRSAPVAVIEPFSQAPPPIF